MILASCASVQKLVDKGQYDEAIYLAAKKISGKKNPKTKHIKALEEAFAKVNRQDLSKIELIKGRGDRSDWDAIYNIASDIAKRQRKVSAFLPLISKNGYYAHFDFVNTNDMMNDAALKASQYHYMSAQNLINEAQITDNRFLYRDAFHALTRIEKYYNLFESKDSLKAIAKNGGTTYVLTKVTDHIINNAYDYAPIGFENRFWTEYHNDHFEGIDYDLVSELVLDDAFISPEREVINRLIENKSIERWVDQIGQDGEVVKDSLGNTLQVKEIETVTARVREILRTKTATLGGIARIKDFSTGKIIDEQPFSITVDFASDAFTMRGDRRALSERIRSRIDRIIEEFPTDYQMLSDAKQKILIAFGDYLEKID